MQVDRRLRSRSDPEHRQQLLSRGCRCVRESCADVDGALTETGFHALDDLVNLGRGCGAIGAIAHRPRSAGVVHDHHPDFDVADADTVIDPLAGGALAVPGSDIRRSELELQRRRHAVQRLEAVGLRRLAVRVQVDEARGDDKPPRIDRVPAGDRVRRDDGDPSVLEPDTADGIERRGRIHHASAENHAVVDRSCL